MYGRLLKVFCRPTNRTRCSFGFGSVHIIQKLHAHHSHTKPGQGFPGHVLDVLAREDDAIRLGIRETGARCAPDMGEADLNRQPLASR